VSIFIGLQLAHSVDFNRHWQAQYQDVFVQLCDISYGGRNCVGCLSIADACEMCVNRVTIAQGLKWLIFTWHSMLRKDVHKNLLTY